MTLTDYLFPWQAYANKLLLQLQTNSFSLQSRPNNVFVQQPKTMNVPPLPVRTG